MRFDRTLSWFAGAALAAGVAFSAHAADQKFISIGTGGVTGVYYPTGGANACLAHLPAHRTNSGIYGQAKKLGLRATVGGVPKVKVEFPPGFDDRVKQGLFREDLFHRLNVIRLRLPPLRERREDILPLARSFLVRHGQRYQRDGIALDEGAERQLMRYNWPGNVRELSHVLERAVLMARRDRIGSDDLGIGTASADVGAAASATPLPDMTLEQAEQMMIRNALDRCSGNIQHTADMLGLSRAALYRRLEKYGMEA